MLTDLGRHPADGGYVISCADEAGCVLLQLEVTQPLVDGLSVLTGDQEDLQDILLNRLSNNNNS